MLTQNQAKKSRRNFYVPTTLQADYDKFLQSDIPGYVMDFVKMRDYFDEESYETIRGAIYPDTAKSRYSNTDNNINFRASLSSDIIKGDYVKDPDGTIYLLDWQIAPESNNKASRAVRCNALLTFSRYHEQTTDEDGYLVQQAGYTTLAEAIPANASRYEGRPEFSSVSNAPGVVPNALLEVSVQMNQSTSKIRIDDEFSYEYGVYVIVDVDFVGVNMTGTNGVLKFQCRKKGGGQYE